MTFSLRNFFIAATVIIVACGMIIPAWQQVRQSLLVESVTCRPAWTEPRDLEFASMDFRVNSFSKPSISSPHQGGAHVFFADGKVFFVTTAITEHELKALLTIAGGEDVTRADLVERGILIGH